MAKKKIPALQLAYAGIFLALDDPDAIRIFKKVEKVVKNEKDVFLFADPKYFPFFYHLGKKVQPRKLLEIGFGLGLVSGCFLQGCKSVQEFTAFQDKRDEFYSLMEK